MDLCGRRGSYPQGREVRQEPSVRGADALFQSDAWRPAERREARGVEELARRAVRLRVIEAQLAAEAHDPRHSVRELGDRQVLSPADVDELGVVVTLHEEQAGVRQVVNVQYLAPRRTAAPDLGRGLAALLGLVELAQ